MTERNICLEWKNLNYSIKKHIFNIRQLKFIQNEVNILKNVSGHVESGSLMAILGSSGAGKTSLLALISQRIRGNYTGQIMINGKNVTRQDMIKISAFVPQFDIACDQLTSEEHLYFMCELRGGKYLTKYEQTCQINQILNRFGLAYISDRKISLLSGGERKKLNLITELLTDPSIIFCDEPTTGLDSFNAFSVIQSLKNLTEPTDVINDMTNIPGISSASSISQRSLYNATTPSKTVICSIHQPTSDVFHCFSHVILMHHGEIAFLGTSAEAMAYFSGLGFKCPINYNPAEYYVKLISTEFVKSNGNDNDQIRRHLCEEQNISIPNMEIQQASWFRQVYLLLKRSSMESSRNLREIFVHNASCLITGIIIALAYTSVTGTDQKSIQSVQGFLFTILAEIYFSSTYCVMFYFPSKLPIMRREVGEQIYHTSSYYVSIVISYIPRGICHAIVFWTIVYPIIGFSRDIWLYIKILLCLICISIASTAQGIAVSTLFDSPKIGLEIAPIIDTILVLFAGIYKIVEYASFVKYISMFYYGNEVLSLIWWNGIEMIDCSVETNTNDNCIENGTQVLEYLHFRKINAIWVDFVGLAALGCVMNLIGFLSVRRMVNRVGYY